MEKSWREILEDALARHAHLAHSRFVSLATVRPDGRPANRTVIFRFFVGGNRLMMTSDSRSEKFQQLAQQPWAELCWYFPESRQQFRLSGPMQCATATQEKKTQEQEILEARQRAWHERTEESRQTFTWPAPGKPRAAASTFQGSVPSDPPENFTLLLLAPQTVELLDLRPHPHERRVFRNDNGSWRDSLINP